MDLQTLQKWPMPFKHEKILHMKKPLQWCWCFASLLDSSFLHLSCCSVFIVFYVTAMWHDHFGCMLDSDTFQLPNGQGELARSIVSNFRYSYQPEKEKNFSVIGTLRKDSHALRLALSLLGICHELFCPIQAKSMYFCLSLWVGQWFSGCCGEQNMTGQT